MPCSSELSISVAAPPHFTSVLLLRLLDIGASPFLFSASRQRAKVARPRPTPPAAAKSDLTPASAAARQAASVSVAISETLINH